MLGLGFWILGFGFLDFWFWIFDFGFLVLDFWFWILGFGFWVLDFGFGFFWGSGAPAAGAASRGLQDRFLEAPGEAQRLEFFAGGAWRSLDAPGPCRSCKRLEALLRPLVMEAFAGGLGGPCMEASGGPCRAASGGPHKILSIQENGN